MRSAIRIGFPLALAATACVLLAAGRRLESYVASPYPLAPTVPYHWAAARQALSPDLVEADVDVEFSFLPGETLSDVLDGLGVERPDAHAVVAALAEHAPLSRLRTVDRYATAFEGESLNRFVLTLQGKGRVFAERDSGGWVSRWNPFERTLEVDMIEGSLAGSLEASIQHAGGDSVLVYRMADVLQWDLDFNRDLRAGDRFRVVYEKVFLDGVYDSVGQIVALVYENGGRLLESYRFGDDGGYYDPDGKPMRKMFLRSPLRYSRVTSRFSHRRFHPVLKRYRPHYGVDYGAPVGTPVRVTANGMVSFAGWDRGGGKTVKVRHPNGYMTAYLHLSKFGRGIGAGRRVTQGETIGYVGSTGLATASHLDYRVQRSGRWIDPMSLRSVPADPIPTQHLAEFIAHRDELRRALRLERPLQDEARSTTVARIAAAHLEEPAASVEARR